MSNRQGAAVAKISVIEVNDAAVGSWSTRNGTTVASNVNQPPQDCKKDAAVVNLSLLWLAEFLGTAVLMFLGCLGCITDYGPDPAPYIPAINFGFSVLVAIQLFGHISGAHINPQVTLAALILGKLKVVTGLLYMLAQMLGAILGFALLKLLAPYSHTKQQVFDRSTNVTRLKPGVCTTVIHEEMSAMQGVIMETIITAILIWVCCAVWDKRNAMNTDSVAVRFAVVVACISIACGPLTGAGMNSARCFAPALLNSYWDRQWVYWIGPTLGSVIAACGYRYLYRIKDDVANVATAKHENIPLGDE